MMGRSWRCAALSALVALLVLLAARPAAACTSYIVAPGASADGSVIIAVRHAQQLAPYSLRFSAKAS